MCSLSPTVTPPPSVVLTARRTESYDIPNIVSHMKYDTERLFGRINVIYLLEKANLAVTVVNQKNVPVAHAVFVDYPNWDIVDQAHWETYIQQRYIQTICTPLNTLFLHLFVTTDHQYATDCCHEIMKTVFKTVPELHFILLFIPSQEDLGTDLAAAFVPMKSITSSIVNLDYRLCMSHRHQYCPQLYIRLARVEDHDDLTPLFARHNDTLRQTYGEYFLAELIEAQNEENLAVVCEDEGVAVGFMSVCSDVNIQLLHECFDLGPFHGLCKPHEDDILKPPVQLPQVPSETGEESSSFESQKDEAVESQATILQVTSTIGSNIYQVSNANVTVSPNETIKREVSELQKEELIAQPLLALPLERSRILGDTGTPSAVSFEREAFHPVYRGAINAFCIQLFCIDEKHETRTLDFLNFVFNLFPDRDFCIISVPHMVPEFHLIQNFVRIIPLSTCTLEHELYVFHRSGLLKSFVVRPAKSDDVPAIEALIKTLELNRSILDDLEKYLSARRDSDGTPVQAFVADVLNQIVAISIIRNEMDVEYIRSHYNIEDFIYFSHHRYEEHGHLYHFALNPIFHHYAKHFMKEILRLAEKSCLYYPIYPQPEEGKFQNPCAHSLTSALHYMVPVRPRRQIVYPLEKLGINAPSKEVSEDQVQYPFRIVAIIMAIVFLFLTPRNSSSEDIPYQFLRFFNHEIHLHPGPLFPGVLPYRLKYALNHFNRKLSLEPKVSINARIVVVGASNVGLSFLETLVFCPHLKFNNLTLISTNGLPGKEELNNLHKQFLINSHCFSQDDYALMSLGSWVNVVAGKMTGIDRSAKHVIVSVGRKVPYDHLILCTGQQYQIPCPTGADIKKLLTNREVSQYCKLKYTGIVPSNLFVICDDEDALMAIKWLKEKIINSSENVIVYGNTIDTYTTIASLLALGISGSHIYLVHPPSQSHVTSLNNNAIEKAVHKALSRAGVAVHRDSLLAQWNDGEHPDPITVASFTTNTKPFQLQCAAFFNFTNKSVDYDAFKAVNDACLVFDGRLVIDTNFHTNDVAIRAAGPLTKFSNIYYANEWTHSNFSSKEVGFQLAATMLNLFDPTLEPVFEPTEDVDRLIPIYKGCKVQGGFLPGRYNYVHIFKPGIPVRLDVQETQPNYGMAITTGDAVKGNYFRIHVNQYSIVETITCLSKNPIPASNYICLFGQHERLLNNLCSRWREGMITNLYSYLKEPWALAIFHDRFIDLQKELRQILVSVQEEGTQSMEELVSKVVEGEHTLHERPKTYLKKAFKQTVYKDLLETSILSYLSYNNYHLPMFAWPGIV